MRAATKKILVSMTDIYCTLNKAIPKARGYEMVKFLREEADVCPAELKPLWNSISEKDRQDMTELFLLDCPRQVIIGCDCGAIHGNEFPDGMIICQVCGTRRHETY